MQAVKDGGYAVVGDLTELRPDPFVPGALGADGPQVEPPAADVLAAQTRTIARLLDL